MAHLEHPSLPRVNKFAELPEIPYNDWKWKPCDSKTGSPCVFLAGEFARPLGHEMYNWDNQRKTYRVVQDLKTLFEDKLDFPNVFRISANVTHLSHDMSRQQVDWNQYVFRITGGPPPITVYIPPEYKPTLVWWAMGKTDIVKQQLIHDYKLLGSALLPEDTYEFNQNLQGIGTSSIFKDISHFVRKEVMRITVPFKDVMDNYREKIRYERGDEDIEFRKLGTFRYKMEVQHAVLVCPPNLVGLDAYPKIDIGEATSFDWIPYCTEGQIYFRMWDHVVFAFLVEEGTKMEFLTPGPCEIKPILGFGE